MLKLATLVISLAMIISHAEGGQAGESQGSKATVQYTVKGFVTYEDSGGMGMISTLDFPTPRTFGQLSRFSDGVKWSNPFKNKARFAKDFQEAYALVATYFDQRIQCALEYQDIAYLTTSGKEFPMRVLAYKACPFEIKELTIRKDIAMREKVVLNVASARGNIIQLAQDSSLPFIISDSPPDLAYICINVVNTEWKFLQSGISFDTNDASFTVLEAGATIAFTKQGITMNGIKRTSKKKP